MSYVSHTLFKELRYTYILDDRNGIESLPHRMI